MTGNDAVPRRIYLDGNSLGPPTPAVADGLRRVVEHEWAGDLVGAWNRRGWWDAPVRVGERIAPLLGAAPGQVVVGDSTTVLLYKVVAAARRLRPDRPNIVTSGGQFPTDRHVIDAVAAQFGATVIEAGAHDTAAAIAAIDDATAVVSLCHVDYRTGVLLDLDAVTRAAHERGAVVVWDLCHSVGAMDLHLDRVEVDLAVGCTYKYLNGGPGSPAFAYVARRHLAGLDQPIPGWAGHADPFSLDESHQPAADIRRLLSGTPPVIALAALSAALEAFTGIDLVDLRARSVALTSRFIALADRDLVRHGFEVVTPRDSAQRGSHVSLRHPHAFEVVQAAIEAGVVGDFREPDLCRFGFAPLLTTLAEVDEAVRRIAALMELEVWRQDRFTVRHTVT